MMDAATLLRKAKLMIRRCRVCGQPIRSPRQYCSDQCHDKALAASLMRVPDQVEAERQQAEWMRHYVEHSRT
jgi:uncharacterized OB-fold protein